MRLRPYLCCVLLLAVVALTGCGSSTEASSRSAAAKRAAARRAEAQRTLANRRQTVLAEASDMTPQSSCSEWLHASEAARNAYLLKHWPHLHLRQVNLVVHQQNLGCQVAPGPHRRTPMGPLQAAVDLVVLGFQIFYEETLAVGIKESVVHYDARALGLRFVPTPQAPSAMRHHR